jgi:hypothetical protein
VCANKFDEVAGITGVLILLIGKEALLELPPPPPQLISTKKTKGK